MTNRLLSETELRDLFSPMFHEVRDLLVQASSGDEELLWALRRKLAKELTYEERSKPAQRKRLKRSKRISQNERCARCQKPLPTKGAVLDRHEAMLGYTPENTQVLCPRCDIEVQESRGYR